MAATPSSMPLRSEFNPMVETRLRESLKRCRPEAVEAALAYRKTGDEELLPIVVRGVIERYVERDLRHKLKSGSEELRLAEDLGVDSLTMMEIVLLAEETLEISVHNEELVDLRTIGDVQRFVARKVRGEEPADLASRETN